MKNSGRLVEVGGVHCCGVAWASRGGDGGRKLGQVA